MAEGNARTVDPPFAGSFALDVEGVLMGHFTEITGLAVTMEVEEVQEGGNNDAVIKLPGRLTWPNLVLKRGLTTDDALLSWLLEFSGQGFAARGYAATKRSATLTLYTARLEPARRWTLREVMPVRWTGPQFAAGGAALAVEELEVSHGGFTSG